MCHFCRTIDARTCRDLLRRKISTASNGRWMRERDFELRWPDWKASTERLWRLSGCQRELDACLGEAVRRVNQLEWGLLLIESQRQLGTGEQRGIAIALTSRFIAAVA